MNKKVLLCILDGWGLSDDAAASAIAQAQTPNFDALWEQYPHTELQAHGLAVGLPENQMGNSEVGHMHLGAGRVLPQHLVNISQELGSEESRPTQLVKDLMNGAPCTSALHIIGLCSDGGVHSYLDHLMLILKHLKRSSSHDIVLHLITDGRDVGPRTSQSYLEQLSPYVNGKRVRIGTVMGRYRAMDRDHRRERIQKAYDAMVQGAGLSISDFDEAISQQYEQGITDEFLEPMVYESYTGFHTGDSLLFRNFRTDRMRQLVQVMTQEHSIEHMQKLDVHQAMTMTCYDETFEELTILFPKEHITQTLGECLSLHGKTQLRAAETEKYPHVTYFFSGGREELFPGEDRLLIASPEVATYDLQPEMSAYQLTDELIEKIESDQPDFVCVNYANPDMVGHTGHMEAVISAVEAVDECLGRLVDVASSLGYELCILADHGNAECMITTTGGPHTAHTCNPVPCILITEKPVQLPDTGGDLTDVAPWILSRLGIDIPESMQHDNILLDATK